MAFLKFSQPSAVEVVTQEKTEKYIIAGNFTAPKALSFDPNDTTRLVLSDNSNLAMKEKFAGVLIEDSTFGQEHTIQTWGEFEHSAFNWTQVRATLYYDSNGNITDIPPDTGKFIQEIGWVISNKKIFIEIAFAINL